MFSNIKKRMDLPGVRELLLSCMPSGSESDLPRLIAKWQEDNKVRVFGFVSFSIVTAIIVIHLYEPGFAQILAIAVAPNRRKRGMGRRLIAETFCVLSLNGMETETDPETAEFYRRLGFSLRPLPLEADGIARDHCFLSKESFYAQYTHEYSSGAALFCRKDGQHYYVVVTELSGNSGLPKGHIEPGESKEETALREIWEETGLLARLIPGFEGEIVYPQGRGMLKHFYYHLAEFTPEQELNPRDVAGATLLNYEAALRKLSFPDVRYIVKKAEAFLEKRNAP